PCQRKAWLCRVLRNRFFDAQRAQKRAQTVFQQIAKQAARITTDGLPVDMQDLLECVPDRYRDVLEKRYALGMTSSEIGRALGIPAATARSRLHAAIKWLRAHRHELI
ncbi:sigma-70 family RNA polymerase sigma factor, partial [Candidatus Bipolaricaulota bacterium]|nr:sigma-70 family RNA polymerase sigma factor [Candidatus Bipolaricaulota bacterium]